MRLYAGNQPLSTDDESLAEAFRGFGEVRNSTVVMDRETGRSRGFACVEMPDDEAARTAMKAMDGASMGGRDIKVNEARPRQGGR
jgi:RNA recognition motif-containing protein